MMKETLADQILDAGFHVAFAGFFLADMIPEKEIRFITRLLVAPTIFVTVFLSFPFLIIGTLVSMWEAS